MIIVTSTDLFHSASTKLFIVSFIPLIALIAVALAPAVMRQAGQGARRARSRGRSAARSSRSARA